MAEYTQRKIITSKDIVPKSRAFTDVLTSFTMHPATHDAAKVKNYAAIKQAMKNLVLTQPGERFYEPDMGCRAQTIHEEIINTISVFDERVRIEDVKVLTNNERHYVTVQVFYAIVGQPKVEQIDFILERPSG